ncbi:MAG: glycosyltransferase family 2 protein [Verrucomicrobiia bacterium]
MKPLVSILIPAYNAQDWIADTIRSALSQTWPGKEIIVVDDGSRDQTLTVARQFASRGVAVVTQDNQGAAAARNHALSLSQGDYLQWLDADDILAPEKVARQMEAAERHPGKRTLYSSAFARFYYRWQQAPFVPTSVWCDLSPTEYMVRKMEENIFMQTMAWLVSRELTEAAGPWDTRLRVDDDGEYFCRILLECDGIVFVPEARSYWRMSGSTSLSQVGRSDRKLEAQLLSMELHLKYVLSRDDGERVRAACVQYLRSWLPGFYPERLDLVERIQQLAVSLGGKLEIPQLSWKYAWIEKLFGWPAAKRTQQYYNDCKSSAIRSWDKALFRLARQQP